jgi:pimeloyl-ACP methyl ester carboxylesterase
MNLMNDLFDVLWHQKFNRPYRLASPINVQSGIPVVLLHGIGRSSEVWNHVVTDLAHKPYHVITFDLLGFGESPKPTWPKYDVDDHARAVIHSMNAQNISSQAILVGHSMGCLIAVRVAQLRPDLVRHLVLYEMPLYAGLPEKRRYEIRLKLYTSVYNRLITYQPSFGEDKRGFAERVAERLRLPKLTEETWQPFVRSLENTIVKQTISQGIKTMKTPMDVIYGSRDMFVIRGEVKNIFGEDATNITAHTVKAGHTISPDASSFIAERVNSAVEGRSALHPQTELPPVKGARMKAMKRPKATLTAAKNRLKAQKSKLRTNTEDGSKDV